MLSAVDNQSFHEEFVSLFPEDNTITSENYSSDLDENCFFKKIPKHFIASISLTELNLAYLHQSGSDASFETEDSELSNQCLRRYIDHYISIDSIIMGEAKRTMVVIKNIPHQYTPKALFEEISNVFYGKFNYFYLPYNNDVIISYSFIHSFIRLKRIMALL